MGGGGIIVIGRLAESPDVSAADRCTLRDIEQRSPAGCSLVDALTVVRILWRYLRP